jgi:hypothetical protein
MFQLEVSIIVAFVMASIVTMVTLISNSSQISSFLSLWVFNSSLILKVIYFEDISRLTCILWYAGLLTLVGLVFFFLTGFYSLSVVIKS